MTETNFEPSEIDPLSVDYLRFLESADDEATTTELKAKTGMSHNELHYRHRKLERLGLVDLDRPASYKEESEAWGGEITKLENPGQPIVARLTEPAKEAMDNGLLEQAGELEANLENLSNRLDGLSGQLVKQRSDLEKEIERLGRATGEVDEFIEGPIAETIEIHRSSLLGLIQKCNSLDRRLSSIEPND